MNIAIVCTLYPPYVLGGAEISTSLLAKGYAAKGHNVVVITTGPEHSEELIDGVKIYRIKNKNIYWRYPQRDKSIFAKALWHFIEIYNVGYFSDIKRILEKEKPEIIHTNNLCGISTVIWSEAEKRNIPIVHTLRDYNLMCPQQTMIKGNKPCEKQCLKCASYSWYKKVVSQKVTAVVGISNFILKHHLNYGYFRKSTFRRVIANSIDRLDIEPDKEKKFKIGYIGRLSPEKGIELLIESFNNSNHEGYELILAGNGNASYENQLRSKYESASVHFIGKTKQANLFNQIDLLVVPSLWNEPFGRVVIEAFSYHKPVLLAANGGLAELVHDGLSKSFSTDNPKELTALLNEYFSGKLVFKEGTFDDVLNLYSEKTIISSYLDLFENILDTKKGSKRW